MKRFPKIIQYDSMDCGATCIRIISLYYGKYFSAESLQGICDPGHDGVSLRVILDTAEILGYDATCGKTTIEKLINQRPFPCIIHWNQNHFVVLYDIRRNLFGKFYFYISDPTKGLQRLNEDKFRASWISTLNKNNEVGIVMTLKPSNIFFEKGSCENNLTFSSFRFIFNKIISYRAYFFQLIFGLLLGSILQFCFPFLTQSIVDSGIKDNDLNIIYLILLGQLVLVLSRTSVDFIRRWLLLHISTRFNLSILSDFLIKLVQLPMHFFDTKMTGDLMQRISDHSRIERFFTAQSLNVLFSFFTLIIFGFVLLYYNLDIFIIFLLGSVLYTLWIIFFLNKRKELDYDFFEQQTKSQNKIIQFINSMQEIKLQNCDRRYRWEWEDIQADAFYINIKSLKLEQTQEAGRILINEIKNILITIFAATLVIHGKLSLGMMLAIQYIIGQLNSPIDQLVQFLHGWQDSKISLERMAEIHQRDDENSNQRMINYFSTSKNICISNLTFQYEGKHSAKVINNINITIPHNKVTAIVGSSGSGKTTLIKLLLGYYNFFQGTIQIGDCSLSDINLKWWRSQCGVVMQDGVLFTDTIANNIAIEEIDEINIEKLKKSAEIANIHSYISQLPLGYNTIIGKDGMGLSQGQKQRILIARAVYREPAFLFFDEATNALDTINEHIIVDNLSSCYKGKTVIIIAHRLSTVKNADQIIVLDKGKVVETGSHSELIRRKAYYYELISNQLELGN
jgi:ATP-binding cassette subfamily B protein